MRQRQFRPTVSVDSTLLRNTRPVSRRARSSRSGTLFEGCMRGKATASSRQGWTHTNLSYAKFKFMSVSFFPIFFRTSSDGTITGFNEHLALTHVYSCKDSFRIVKLSASGSRRKSVVKVVIEPQNDCAIETKPAYARAPERGSGGAKRMMPIVFIR